MRNTNKYTQSAVTLGLVTLGLSLAGSSSAQTFSLSPSTGTASVGGTVIFTVSLNPAVGGNTNLIGYDTNLFINSTYLKFVGTAPFSPSAASASAFPNTERSTNTQTTANGLTDLRITYDNNNSDASFTTSTVLGTFSVTVLSQLPAGGTPITFGPKYTGPSSSASQGGSELVANFGANEVLQGVSNATLSPTPAPEPSQAAALGLGVLGLAGLALRARRMKKNA